MGASMIAWTMLTAMVRSLAVMTFDAPKKWAADEAAHSIYIESAES
jgi:hypothetical protein